MSDTPRTDAEAGFLDEGEYWRPHETGFYVDADFARELERENAALRKEKDKLELERCEMLRSWDLTINHNAALVEAFAKADVLAEHSRFDGRREWTVVEMWVYPNDIIVQMDRAAFNAARKEGQP
jgi:hypothetical protein